MIGRPLHWSNVMHALLVTYTSHYSLLQQSIHYQSQMLELVRVLSLSELLLVGASHDLHKSNTDLLTWSSNCLLSFH